MGLLSKLREARLGLSAGVVTLAGLGEGRPLPARLRGRPLFDAARCVGCGACASNCPAREIELLDASQELRVLIYGGRRCTYCGRCADVCPEGAITMSHDFQQATDRPGDLEQRLELAMGTCQRCGRCFRPRGPLDALRPAPHRPADVEIELEG
jgi:hydrogenase-4 component H